MTTRYYVSNSTANGFVVGNDSNDGLSKLTPKLTMKGAFTAISGNGGDTQFSITVNDGSYSIDATTQCAFIRNTSVDPVSDYGVTLAMAAGFTGSFFVPNVGLIDGATIDVGKIIIDCGNTVADQTHSNEGLALTPVSGKTYLVILRGPRIKNPRFRHIYDTRTTGNLTGWWDQIVDTPALPGARGTLIQAARTSGNIAIDGTTISHVDLAVAGYGGILVDITTANSCTCSIKNVTGTINLLSTAVTGTYIGVRVNNIANTILENNNLDILFVGATTPTSYLYNIGSTLAISSANSVIRKCNGHNGTTGGIMALIGSDGSSAGDNYSNNGLIEDCVLTSTNSLSTHGAMLGNNTGGEIRGNTITGSSIPLLRKANTGGKVFGNKVINPTGFYGMYSKGSTDGGFYNNDFFITSDSILDTTFRICYVGDNVAIHSANIDVKNNNFYIEKAPLKIVEVAALNTANFDNNNYYSTVALNAASFAYQGTTYDTIEQWIAAKDANGLNINPGYDSNKTITNTTLKTRGKAWWVSSGRRPVGFDGEPFADFNISVGSTQTINANQP